MRLEELARGVFADIGAERQGLLAGKTGLLEIAQSIVLARFQKGTEGGEMIVVLPTFQHVE